MGTTIQTRIRPKKGGHRYIVTDSRTTTEELNKKSQINHDNLCTCHFYPLKVRARCFFLLKGNRAENSWVASQALQTTGSWNTRTCGPKSRRLMFDNIDNNNSNNNCNIKIVSLQIVSDNDERINTILLKYWFLRKITILNDIFFSKNAKKKPQKRSF